MTKLHPPQADSVAGPVPTPLAWSAAVAFACFMMFWQLGGSDWHRSEAMRVVVAREMAARGDRVVPSFFGEVMPTKPPGQYVAIAAAGRLLGPRDAFLGINEFTSRLPGALAAFGMIGLVAWRLTGVFGPTTGLASVIVLPSSWNFVATSGTAEIDGAFTALTFAGVLLVVMPGRDGVTSTAGAAAAGYALLTLAMLFKGWPALMFTFPTLLVLSVFLRQPGVLLRLVHVAGAAAMLGAIFGWVALVAHRVGVEVLADVAANEQAGRLNVLGAGHWLGAASHPAKIAAAFLPTTMLAAWAVWRPWRAWLDPRQRVVVLAMLAVLLAGIVQWSVLPAHSTRHTLPMYPAAAVLAAIGVARWPRDATRLGAFVAVTLRATLAVLAGLAGVGGVVAVGGLLEGAHGAAGPFLVLAGAGAAAGLIAVRRQRRGWALALLAVGLVGMKLAQVHVFEPHRGARQVPPDLGRQVRAAMPAGQPLHLVERLYEVAMVYAADRIVLHRQDDAQGWPTLPAGVYVLATADAAGRLDVLRDAEVVARFAGGGRLVPGDYVLLWTRPAPASGGGEG